MISSNIKWMWNGADDPWSKETKFQWINYTSIENELIENAYRNQLTKIELENYEIDFINKIQINKNDRNRQRQIYRHILREERFLHEPIIPKSSVQFNYISYYSLFIFECQRQKIITIKKLKNIKTKHLIIELIAQGIIDEGYIANEIDVAKNMANELLEKKFSSLDEIYACIIKLYTVESFLYKILNNILRLADDNLSNQDTYKWTSKLYTLGPYAMILDCALSYYSTHEPMIVYRTAKLTVEQIEQYKTMKYFQCGFFSSFTSLSHSIERANAFKGNVLFIIELPKRYLSISSRQGLTDVQKFSVSQHEQEVIMRPATLFHVNSLNWNSQTQRHEIYLTIM